jgi:hypothetical protein
MTDELVDISYWLPITTVNLTGSIVTVRGKTDETIYKTQATPVVVTVFTRPDYDVACRLRLSADKWLTQHAKIEMLPDARLSSAESKTEHHRWDEVTSAAKLAGLGAGIGLGLGGPLGAAVGGVAGAALAVAAAEVSTVGVQKVIADLVRIPDDGEPGIPKQPDIDYNALDIDRHYVTYDENAAALLAELRLGEAHALLDFGAAASGRGFTRRTAAALADTKLRLKLIRAELALSESAYQQWLNSRTRTTTELFDLDVAINLLPTEASAKEWLTQPSEGEPSTVTALRELCHRFGVVITSDFPALGSHHDTDSDRPSDDVIRYRSLVPAVLRTFSAKIGDSTLLELVRISRILAAVPGQERTVPLFGKDADDRALNLAFDPSGALTTIASDDTGSGVAAAKAISDLPDAFAGGAATGGTLAEPFTSAGRAKALQAQVDEKKAMAALSPRADPLQELRDQVTKAELDARRSAAERATTDPTTTAVIVIGGATPAE